MDLKLLPLHRWLNYLQLRLNRFITTAIRLSFFQYWNFSRMNVLFRCFLFAKIILDCNLLFGQWACEQWSYKLNLTAFYTLFHTTFCVSSTESPPKCWRLYKLVKSLNFIVSASLMSGIKSGAFRELEIY